MNFDLDKMYCGAIRRGDVFICEIDDKKERPVVVLQDNVLNEGMATVICAAVAPFNGDEVLVNEVLLKKTETGLGKDSVCALHKIFTVDRRFMISKKGELKKDKLQEVYKALDISLGRFRDRK